MHPSAFRTFAPLSSRASQCASAAAEYAVPNLVEKLERVYRTGETRLVNEVMIEPSIRVRNRRAQLLELYLPCDTKRRGVIDGVMTFDVEVTDQVLAREKSDA